MTRRIVMVGSALDVKGGVSAMARVCESEGLFARSGVEYVASHCDGSPPRKLARAASGLVRFSARLVARRVALLHVHLNSDASFWRKSFFVAAARRAGVPYVLHVHCGNFGRFVSERAGARGQAIARRMLDDAAGVVALSPAGARELEAIAPGIPVEVIPNPVSLAPPSAPPPGPPVVASLGMLTEAKGAFDLVRAWNVASRGCPGARLVLAGTGEMERIRALIEELGLTDSIELPGWIGPDARTALLRRASVFVLASHAEALPMAVLEAMAAGVPVVASRVGGVPWMLEEGEAGVLVPPRDIGALADALGTLMADPARRASLAVAGRERVACEFDAAVVLPRIERLWSGLRRD